MAHVKLEEQELCRLKEEEHSVVREFKEEPEFRDIQSLEDSTSVCMKEEPEEIKPEALPFRVSVKSEEEEPQSSVFHQTVTKQSRENTDAAGAVSQKLPESEQHSDDSSDTDNSEDWAPSAGRPNPQTQSQLNEKLDGATHRNNISEGARAKRHKCSHCGKGYRFLCRLRIHERSHTGERPFKCTVCQRTFSRTADLNYHMKTTHMEINDQLHVAAHGNSEGATAKKHTCSHCGKKFKTPRNLRIHEHIHTEERQFKCTLCEKDYIRLCHLNEHMRRSHIGVPQKLFKCSVCAKAFNYKYHLQRHIKIHTGEKPFKCTVCSKDFTDVWGLNSHLRTHTGEKNYKCPFCEKRFSFSRSLKEHIMIHTGEKPYKCSVCGKRFISITYLKRHMWIHPDKKPVTCSVDEKDVTKTEKHMRTHTAGKLLEALEFSESDDESGITQDSVGC